MSTTRTAKAKVKGAIVAPVAPPSIRPDSAAIGAAATILDPAADALAAAIDRAYDDAGAHFGAVGSDWALAWFACNPSHAAGVDPAVASAIAATRSAIVAPTAPAPAPTVAAFDLAPRIHAEIRNLAADVVAAAADADADPIFANDAATLADAVRYHYGSPAWQDTDAVTKACVSLHGDPQVGWKRHKIARAIVRAAVKRVMLGFDSARAVVAIADGASASVAKDVGTAAAAKRVSDRAARVATLAADLAAAAAEDPSVKAASSALATLEAIAKPSRKDDGKDVARAASSKARIAYLLRSATLPSDLKAKCEAAIA